MATGTFLTEHGDGARDRAGEPQQDMNAHHGQKDWISVEGASIPAMLVILSVMLMLPAL
jgi:hypothetical protein